MNDNVIPFKHRVKKTTEAVPAICEVAGKIFKEIIIMGENHDGEIQMITTVSDPAEVLWYMEAARFGIMTGGIDDE